MKNIDNGVWLTWEHQRRNKGISDAFGWRLYEVTHKGARALRYVKSLYETISIFMAKRPDFVVAQNPSLLLALTAVLSKYLFGYTCIIDAHNAGLFPFEGKNKLLNSIAKVIQAMADLTIVTNTSLSDVVATNKGRAYVLQDRIPEIPAQIHPIQLRGDFNLAFICSFSPDEPYLEIIEAAKLLPSNVCIHITGNFKGKVNESSIPPNVTLLGFVPDSSYWSVISSADAIIVLTKRENCLVCGAYEAVALGKPMLLSDTKAIMGYFSSGCLYTKPSVADIGAAILLLIEQRNKLQQEVEVLKSELTQRWEQTFAGLVAQIRAIR